MKKFRVWKLGSLEHKIYPSKEAADKLEKILKDALGEEGVKDIIWGPDLSVHEIGGDDTIEEYVVTHVEEVGNEVIIRAKRIAG